MSDETETPAPLDEDALKILRAIGSNTTKLPDIMQVTNLDAYVAMHQLGKMAGLGLVADWRDAGWQITARGRNWLKHPSNQPKRTLPEEQELEETDELRRIFRYMYYDHGKLTYASESIIAEDLKMDREHLHKVLKSAQRMNLVESDIDDEDPTNTIWDLTLEGIHFIDRESKRTLPEEQELEVDPNAAIAKLPRPLPHIARELMWRYPDWKLRASGGAGEDEGWLIMNMNDEMFQGLSDTGEKFWETYAITVDEDNPNQIVAHKENNEQDSEPVTETFDMVSFGLDGLFKEMERDNPYLFTPKRTLPEEQELERDPYAIAEEIEGAVNAVKEAHASKDVDEQFNAEDNLIFVLDRYKDNSDLNLSAMIKYWYKEGVEDAEDLIRTANSVVKSIRSTPRRTLPEEQELEDMQRLNFKPFTEADWEGFSGSEVFASGEEPLLGQDEFQVTAEGMPPDVSAGATPIIDGKGVYIGVDYSPNHPPKQGHLGEDYDGNFWYQKNVSIESQAEAQQYIDELSEMGELTPEKLEEAGYEHGNFEPSWLPNMILRRAPKEESQRTLPEEQELERMTTRHNVVKDLLEGTTEGLAGATAHVRTRAERKQMEQRLIYVKPQDVEQLKQSPEFEQVVQQGLAEIRENQIWIRDPAVIPVIEDILGMDIPQ